MKNSLSYPKMDEEQKRIVCTLLRDELADDVALRMAKTDLGKNISEQDMRDICRAFACNLRRLVEGKWML